MADFQTHVVASPAPTTTTFSVTPGDGAHLIAGRRITVGNQIGYILSKSTDAITLRDALATAPSTGGLVDQANANMYCTIGDVRALGLTDITADTDAQIIEAIVNASSAIESFTGDYFVPTGPLTIRAELGGRGIAPIRSTVNSVVSATFEAMSTSLATSSYRVHSSETPGDYDGIQFAVAGWDDTIAGAEREEGGFSALFAPGRALIIVAYLGTSSTPLDVITQTAFLAYAMRTGTTDQDVGGMTSAQATNARGRFDPNANLARTTGDSRVDRALREYRKDMAYFMGV